MSILEGAEGIGAATVSRRGVLVGLGGASLVAGIAVLGADHVARAAHASPETMARCGPISASTAEVTGYHVTEHIRQYYRTARL